MNLRTSIAVNYVGQIYVTLISMVLVPVYLRYMGAEAYGFIGFFSLLFSLFYLLDFGLTPSISRETARFYGGAISAHTFRQLFRALGLTFSTVAVLGAVGLCVASEWVVKHWLKLEKIPYETAEIILQLMTISVALRWMGGLYRGVLTGGERMVWLSAFNALVATLRFVGVLVAMQAWGYTVEVFFIYQLAIAVLEFLALAIKTHGLLPTAHVNGWSLHPLRPILQFGLLSALSSTLGVLLMQSDKLLLSGLLPLADYGHFSLAVVIATSVMVASAPISTALLPRMARLHAEGREAEMLSIYRLSTRLTSSFGLGGALILAFCAHPLLMAWTGDPEWATVYWPVLSLYALGNGFWVLGSFPYYMQYAKGQLRSYLFSNIIFLCLQIPLLAWAVQKIGVSGAGVVWLVLSFCYFFIWGAFVHRKFKTGLHTQWILRDVLAMNWPVFTGIFLIYLLDWQPESRRESLLYVVLIGGFLLLLNAVWLAWSERELIKKI